MKKKVRVKKTTTDCVKDPVGYYDATKVHPDLKEFLGYCLHKASTIFRAQINEVLAEHQLQAHHFAILSVISSSEPINQMKIGEEMGIDKASMVKITDHLEQLECIERVSSKEDRRVKNLFITAKGRKLLKEARAQRAEVEKNFLRGLNDEEKIIFKSILLKILDNQNSSQS